MVRQSDNAQIPTSVSPYYAPVNPSYFIPLWVTLIALGIAMMGWFFIYEVGASKPGRLVKVRGRSFLTELTLAGLSSILLGFGVLFLLLWAGVWV